MGISFGSSHPWVWTIRAYTFGRVLAEPLRRIGSQNSITPFFLLSGKASSSQSEAYAHQTPNISNSLT